MFRFMDKIPAALSSYKPFIIFYFVIAQPPYTFPAMLVQKSEKKYRTISCITNDRTNDIIYTELRRNNELWLKLVSAKEYEFEKFETKD